jgi:hypothetical protein
MPATAMRLPSFVFNPFPSPGRSNPDNGRVGPNVRFEGVDPFSLGPTSAALHRDGAG